MFTSPAPCLASPALSASQQWHTQTDICLEITKRACPRDQICHRWQLQWKGGTREGHLLLTSIYYNSFHKYWNKEAEIRGYFSPLLCTWHFLKSFWCVVTSRKETEQLWVHNEIIPDEIRKCSALSPQIESVEKQSQGFYFQTKQLGSLLQALQTLNSILSNDCKIALGQPQFILLQRVWGDWRWKVLLISFLIHLFLLWSVWQ